MEPKRARAKYPFSLSMMGWALNEEVNIQQYIDRAGRFLSDLTDDYELIIIDDGSTDRTWAIAQECQQTRPWLRIFQNDRNRGAGYNAKRCIALTQKDYILWQTVDWAYDISNLGQYLGLLEKYDVLQGVRAHTVSLKGLLRNRSDNPWKGFVSVVNYLVVRVLFRLPIHDYQNVTVYPRKLIQSVILESESSFINPECLLKTWWKGTTFKEVPIGFLKRQRGVAKGTRPGAIVAALQDIAYWWFRWIILRKRQDFGRGKVDYWSEDAELAQPISYTPQSVVYSMPQDLAGHKKSA